MKLVRRSYSFILLVSILAVAGMLVPAGQSSAATNKTLAWNVVDTPSDGSNGMFIRTCGINDMALGPDNLTFYAVSTDNSTPGAAGLFKSTDAGYTWLSNIGTNLTAAVGMATVPVWNIAVAPDDSKFIIAVIDGSGTPAGGPRMAYYSNDGGTIWTNTGLTLNVDEYISCIDIARYDSSDQLRDIAIGTRTSNVLGQGRLLTRPYGNSFSGTWTSQGLPTWTAVTSVKFSPSYNPDQTMAVVAFTTAPQAALHLGKHDTIGNTTQWDIGAGYPAYPVVLGAYSSGSIIRTGIELPSDYVGTDLNLRGCFVNVFDSAPTSAVFYISPTPTRFSITPPIQLASGQSISSIAYTGTNFSGILLAGEAKAITARALVNIWQSSNAQATCSGCVTWLKSDSLKSPTGGGNIGGGGTGRANALLAWNGGIAYCGTSSENSTAGGTGSAPGQWPFSKLTKVPSDESAFQYSPDGGYSWNQVGIINTIITYLSDVAASEKPEGSKDVASVLYLASINDNATVSPDIDSVWRSRSDPLGRLWERTFTLPSSDSGTILRLPLPTTDSTVTGLVVFADLGTDNLTYSTDFGDIWQTAPTGRQIKDLCLLNENTMFLLDDLTISKMTRPCGPTSSGYYSGGTVTGGLITDGNVSGSVLTGSWSDSTGSGSFRFALNASGGFDGTFTVGIIPSGTWTGRIKNMGGCPWSGTWNTTRGSDDMEMTLIQSGPSIWTPAKRLSTNLLAPGHTVTCAPKGNSDEELVFVGSEGNSNTSVAWVDFTAFNPQFAVLKEMPMQGNVHIVADDLYSSYQNIYAGIGGIGGIGNVTDSEGAIYRWTMKGDGVSGSLRASIDWDLLEPPDSGFYGICMLNSVLYGAWATGVALPIYSSGADRTLEARVRVPPAPQWDQLVDGLPPPPPPPNPNQVEFTLEPTSMHISSNAYNTLWAIDDHPYNFTLKQGCLWQFVDSVAKLGPWPTTPAPGSLIGADPVTGRSQQVDFKWRPMRDIFGYDVLIAKDVNFTLPLSQQLHMTPVDDVTGAWIVTPADQEDPSCWIAPGELEVGRSYYWMVRASRSWKGTPIHSPWSPTMFFSVRPGFMVTSEYMGPTLLAPVDGICSNCMPPMRFSWSPIKNAEMYEFTLARDAQLKDVIVQETTSTTGYELKSKLPLSTPYYWQVKAVAPVISDPSPVGTFTLTENITPPQKQPAVKTKPGAVPAPSNFWIWIIIVIVVVLLLLINAYVFISRRRDM